MPKVEVMPKKARKAPTSIPKEPEKTFLAARSTTFLNPDLVSGLVPFTSSHEHDVDSGALPLNPHSLGTSLQRSLSPVSTP